MMDRPGRIALPDDQDDDLERQAVNSNSHNVAASADGPNDTYADDFDISDNEDAGAEAGAASKTAPDESTPDNSTATPASTANGASSASDDDDQDTAKKK